MENISIVKDVLHPADYLGKIDLKDAYLTVPIFIGHRKYLRFSWKGKHFQFKSLPFGLATAPRVFSKLLQPLAAQMKKMGIRMIIYLDDTLILADSLTMLKKHMEPVAQELRALGFTINLKRCIWEPNHADNRISGFLNQLDIDDDQSAKRQDKESVKGMQTCIECDQGIRTTVGSTDWPVIVNDSHDSPSTTTLQSSGDPAIGQ